jgi:hypothetical protein
MAEIISTRPIGEDGYAALRAASERLAKRLDEISSARGFTWLFESDVPAVPATVRCFPFAMRRRIRTAEFPSREDLAGLVDDLTADFEACLLEQPTGKRLYWRASPKIDLDREFDTTEFVTRGYFRVVVIVDG